MVGGDAEASSHTHFPKTLPNRSDTPARDLTSARRVSDNRLVTSAPASPRTTTPPAGGVPIAFYDGHCRVCTEQAQKLARLGRGKIALRSFQEAGALDAFPGLTHEACMRELKLVDARGRLFGGAEAVVRALNIGRPVLGKVALGYYVPGVRWLADRAYAWVARNRYKLFGRIRPECDGDACRVHFE